MKFKINRTLPITIKDQLKKQIRGLIKSKQLTQGQTLPSCSDMASILSINRNTVATVYAELAAEGVVESNKGAGTIISKKNLSTQNPMTSLDLILKDALDKATKEGFSSEEITDQFFSLLATNTKESSKTILMVWCNHMTMLEVGEVLEKELQVATKRMLVKDVEQFPEKAAKYLDEVDLVVTSINYMDAILPLAKKHDVEVVGIILTPVSRVINEIVKLPPQTTVGFVCVNSLAAEATCKGVLLSGQVTLKTIWAGANNTTELEEMISECEVIFATHHIYDKVFEVAGDGKKIVKVDSSITDSNVQLIKERLWS